MDTSDARERLARQVAGAVLDGSDPAAAAEAAGFNTAVTHRPAVVVAAEQRRRRRGGRAVRPRRRGSRSPSRPPGTERPRPADGTVLVSTTRMQGVQVDPVARAARVEAGVRWRSVIDAAVPHGLAPLSGSSSGVGVVGYTLGGGMGHLARRHGFAADHVRSVELVTAGRARSGRSPPRATRSCSGRCAAVRAASGSSRRWSSTWSRCPEFFGGAMIFAAPPSRRCCTPSPTGRRRCRRRSPPRSRCCGCPRSTSAATAARGRQPGPALRLHRLRRAGRGAARADAPGRRPAAGLRRPDVVRRRRRHPHGPDRADARRRCAAGCCTRCPSEPSTPCSRWPARTSRSRSPWSSCG